jgi:putative transcriptional regulator
VSKGGRFLDTPTRCVDAGAALRARLRLSQPIFARALNVSPDTVRAWEQGKRRPDGAALRLLQVTERYPNVIVEHVRRRSA